jgi:hypothetical protein
LLVKTTVKVAEQANVSATLSCAQCGAALRPEQDWCHLCFASTTAPSIPDFDPLTAPLAQVMSGGDSGVAPQPEAKVGPALPPLQSTEPAQPASWAHPTDFAEAIDFAETNESVSRADDATPDVPPSATPELSDVDVMLSMLAAEHRRGDATSDLAQRFEDKGTRFLVIGAGMTAVMVLGFVALTLLGHLF